MEQQGNSNSGAAGKDLCPAYPDVWRAGEICAIISHTGDGKSLFAETIAAECNKARKAITAYIDDHNGELFGERLGDSPHIHFKDARLWNTERITDYIGWAPGLIVVDLNNPADEEAKAVGDALHAAVTDAHPSHPLITIQGGRGMEEQIKLFRATRLTLLERAEDGGEEEMFNVTANWRTPDAYSYKMRVAGTGARGGIRLIRV